MNVVAVETTPEDDTTEVLGGTLKNYYEEKVLNVMRQVKAQQKGINRLNRKIFRLESALQDAMDILTPAQTMELLRRANNKSVIRPKA